MAKVYVLATDYGYEGYNCPYGAYSTREKAEAVAKSIDTSGCVEVFELEIDAEPGR